MTFFFRTALFSALVVVVILFIVDRGVNTAVDHALRDDAINKAEHWGDYMARRVPDLDGLIASGVPTAEQQRAIYEVRQLGDIFRFKLFTAEGRLSLLSDDTNIAGAGGIADTADLEPKQVAKKRVPIVFVKDGSGKPDRPEVYAEAYIPLMADNGDVRGVVEVYVDESITKSFFVASFRKFGFSLAGLIALVLAVPTAGFVLQRVFAQRSRQEAEFLACYDSLTGLLNRREFVIQAEKYLADESLTVICYLDLDRFKTINDTYGHSAGDKFLSHVAEVLRTNCRPDDLLARFGGDEFVIAFQNISIESAVHRVRGILKDCAREIEIQNSKLTGSVSVGLAEVAKGASLDCTLRNADAALYHAKSSGRNDFAIYGAKMGVELRRRRALEARLRQATQELDFEIHYQPLVDGVERKVIGHEALLRLTDIDGSVIPPTVFVPLAEELGLIDEIGRWTIRTAMREIAMNNNDSMLAINLSTAQFSSGELVKTVREALSETGFSANRLELEITESLLLEDSPLVEMQIDTLKEMGVSIAMDDFGTGFSSLSYLWKYGFDRLKIDRSFVAALDENPERSREIIETVVLLGARLGMKITAEGVETIEQSNLLSDLGCDVLQGYLFGRASPLANLQREITQSTEPRTNQLPFKRA